MPNNCSTLIQRKQNILHKILRSNSDGKLHNAVAETTAELYVSGTGKTASPSSSTHHLSMAAGASSTARRSNLFASNRIQPSSNHFYEAHLPSIRDSHGSHDFQARLRTPSTNNNLKNTGRPPSASISSIFNVLAKRSTDNFANVYGDYEEINTAHPVPPSRRSQRPHKMNGHNGSLGKQQTILTQNGNEIRFTQGSTDADQQRNGGGGEVATTRYRGNASQTHLDSSPVQNSLSKERTQFGPLYQRRQNNSIKTSTKQKIDKYRRRSEEVTQALTGGTSSMNNSFNTATHTAANSPLNRSKQTTNISPVASIQHIPIDDDTNTRFEVLRLSMDANLLRTDQPKKSQSQQQARNSRVKSPYLYSNHQQIKPATPVLNPPTQATRLRRSHTPTQQDSSVNSSQHQNILHAAQQNPSVKISANASPGNLYLAFIASRHVSTIEDALLESDIDHQKLLRIFTWLKNVEDHRHEQSDHDQLLIEQNQQMLEQEENLSLYSEILHAVDDLPANTSGKPCEKIATMQFED